MLSSPGVGSGLDINSIISQLMQIERRPLVRLEEKKADYEAQLSAYGKISSAMSTFQDALSKLNDVDKFKVFSATSSDETVFTATADSTASQGSYEITVNSLARREQWYSLAESEVGAYDSTANLTGGTLSITLAKGTADEASFDATIAAGASLTEIRDAINDAASTAGVGVSASIVTDAAGSRLMISSDETGATNTIEVTATGDAQLDALTTANMTQLQAGADASFQIGSGATALTMTSATNTVEGAIQGVTLELKTEGATSTLTVDRDTGAIADSVQEFVDAYNALITTIQDQRDPEDGDLAGDSTLVSMQSMLWKTLNTPASGITSAFSYLSEIGVKTGDGGKLTLDSTELQDALDSDFAGVSELFANNPDGVLYRFDALVDDFLASDIGLIDIRKDGINERIDALDSRMDTLEYRLELTKKRYEQQFWSLDALVGQMNSTGSYLAQQLAALPRY